MKKRTNRFFAVLAIAACFCLPCFGFFSCASSRLENDAYYAENVKDFSIYSLKNKIPVVFKKTSGGQILVLRMMFEGGTPLVPVDKAGIEGLTLSLMLHGSEKYSYEDIQNMQYSTTFSMTSSSGRDYSVAGIKCLQKDLDTVLDVFFDSVLNPSLSSDDFAQFMLNEKESLASTLSDPSGQLGVELEKEAFSSTSYASSTDITEDSINSITLDDVKAHHKRLLDAGRIKIVVVANMDTTAQKELVSKLDSFIGGIEKGSYNAPSVPKITVSGDDIRLRNAQAGTSGYSIGFFDCPERYDSDYVPFAIALMYLDDIFFGQVREQAGAVYSIGTGVIGGKEMLGVISAYKISDNENIRTLIYKAIDSFPVEKEAEKKLDQYKNKYITTLFDSTQSGSGVAASIITSIEYSGKPDSYLRRSAEVQKVKASDVVAAYKKYIAQDGKDGGSASNKIRWITVTQ